MTEDLRVPPTGEGLLALESSSGNQCGGPEDERSDMNSLDRLSRAW